MTVKEAWIEIRDLFETKSVNLVIDAISSLASPPPGEPLPKKIRHIREIFHVIAQSGINHEQHVMLHILDEMSDESKHIHTHWYDIPVNEWSLTKFAGHALAVHKSLGTEADPIEVAMRTDEKATKKKGQNKKKTNKWCKFHKSHSHNTEDCRSLKQKEEAKNVPVKAGMVKEQLLLATSQDSDDDHWVVDSGTT
ncbi:hypothetical protein IWQ61_010632, partial [Dispira simplex]